MAFSAVGSGSAGDSALFAGGQLGVNYQTGIVVFGAEADLNNFKISNNLARVETPPASVTLNSSASVAADWMATLRARVGLTNGRTLIYATGGLAITDVAFNQSNTYQGVGTQRFTSSDTQYGWVIGGGAEFMIDRNWSFKAEFLHLDFGSISGQASFPGFVGNHSHSADLKAEVGRAGINFRF